MLFLDKHYPANTLKGCDCSHGCGRCDCGCYGCCDTDCGHCGMILFIYFWYTKCKNKRNTTIVGLKDKVSNIFDTNLCLPYIQI